jgi:hypothetical protein
VIPSSPPLSTAGACSNVYWRHQRNSPTRFVSLKLVSCLPLLKIGSYLSLAGHSSNLMLALGSYTHLALVTDQIPYLWGFYMLIFYQNVMELWCRLNRRALIERTNFVTRSGLSSLVSWTLYVKTFKPFDKRCVTSVKGLGHHRFQI